MLLQTHSISIFPCDIEGYRTKHYPVQKLAFTQQELIGEIMNRQSWDPLASRKEADTEILTAAQKREIKNILKSYVGMYDPFSELIQNAMDAVDRRANELLEHTYERQLWLTIDLSENSFTVTDNGIGFNEKEFRSFLAPNISFKEGTESRGNKGVGATYIAYGFDYLQFGTKGNGHEFIGEIVGGRDWVEDYKGLITRPVVNPSDSYDPHFEEISRGSTFKVKFGGKNTRPKDLSWYAANTSPQWLYLLLIKTPLGSINYIDDSKDLVKFNLKVIDKKGSETLSGNQETRYIFPHSKIKASVNLKEVLEFQEKLLGQGRDVLALPNKFNKSNGIYEFFSTKELKTLRKADDQESLDLIEEYKIEAYGYFAYSTAIWDQFNDTLAQLRKGYRVLRGGLQLANNHMIQGDLVAIPLTSNIGYQNQCHIVVHFKNADPDLGRKGFQPELRDVAEKISVAIVNRLKKWKKLLKSDNGSKPDIAKEMELYEWIKEQEKYEENNPLIISNKNFFAPMNEISITSLPRSEQDVIVLFNQLIAGGVIRGINLLATSQTKQYDGVYKFVVKQPLQNQIFDIEKNPLGVEELHFRDEHISPPKILEYKYNLDALIHEFENDEKKEKDIHLVVSWEIGDEWKKNYDVTSLLNLDSLHQRAFHGITHLFNSGTTQFYAIGLKELVEYLNDVNGVQDYHRKQYGDDPFS